MIEFIRRLFRPYLELKRGIVNLKSGTAFRGVVYAVRGPLLVMRQVEMLNDRGTLLKGTPPVVDGEVVIARSEIDFVQVVR
jgi:hypothetical protein